MLGWAVYCCWKIVSACWLSQAGTACSPTFVYLPLVNNGESTWLYPLANNVALLSVGEPSSSNTWGLDTPHEAMQSTAPWPIRLPTLTLLKLT